MFEYEMYRSRSEQLRSDAEQHRLARQAVAARKERKKEARAGGKRGSRWVRAA